MKNIIILSGILLSGIINAQVPVFVNTFDTSADVQGWRFKDGNANGNQWVQGANMYHNGTSMTYGTAGVLRYTTSMVPSGTVPGFATEDDWAISPEIDLTGASGSITFAAVIGRMRTNQTTVDRSIWIYVSTPTKPVPDFVDFQAMTIDANGNEIESNYTFTAGGAAPDPQWPSNLSDFVQATTIDLSVFAGQKIYIGLWSHRRFSGNSNIHNVNIDEIGIYADVNLGSSDVKVSKNFTKVMQNPVGNSLQLKLNPNLAEAKTNVQVYNTVGQQVINAKYSREIPVIQLAPGMYIALVTDGITTEKVKFTKK